MCHKIFYAEMLYYYITVTYAKEGQCHSYLLITYVIKTSQTLVTLNDDSKGCQNSKKNNIYYEHLKLRRSLVSKRCFVSCEVFSLFSRSNLLILENTIYLVNRFRVQNPTQYLPSTCLKLYLRNQIHSQSDPPIYLKLSPTH